MGYSHTLYRMLLESMILLVVFSGSSIDCLVGGGLDWAIWRGLGIEVCGIGRGWGPGAEVVSRWTWLGTL